MFKTMEISQTEEGGVTSTEKSRGKAKASHSLIFKLKSRSRGRAEECWRGELKVTASLNMHFKGLIRSGEPKETRRCKKEGKGRGENLFVEEGV